MRWCDLNSNQNLLSYDVSLPRILRPEQSPLTLGRRRDEVGDVESDSIRCRRHARWKKNFMFYLCHMHEKYSWNHAISSKQIQTKKEFLSKYETARGKSFQEPDNRLEGYYQFGDVFIFCE